jgi:hypothetical protein
LASGTPAQTVELKNKKHSLSPQSLSQEFQLLDSGTGTVVRAIPTPGSLWNARWRFSPDSRALAVWYKKGRSTDPNIFERPMTVDLWDVPGR